LTKRFFTLRPSVDDFSLIQLVDSITVSRIVDGIKLEDEELRPILTEARASARRERGIQATLVLYVFPCLLAVIAILVGWLIHPPFMLNLLWHAAVDTIIASGLLILFIWFYRPVYNRLMLRHIRLAMQKRGYNLCAECGYDLRGAEHEACPECGAPQEPLSKFPEMFP